MLLLLLLLLLSAADFFCSLLLLFYFGESLSAAAESWRDSGREAKGERGAMGPGALFAKAHGRSPSVMAERMKGERNMLE